MFILYAVVLGILAGYLTGGRLKYVAERPLIKIYLAFLAIAIQLVIFSDFSFVKGLPDFVIAAFHIVSYLCVIIFVILNIRIPGVVIISIGALLNSAAIFLNGGFMPSKTAFLQTSAQIDNNIKGISAGTLLPWLGDIFHLPRWLPLSVGFSIGDVLIAIGVCTYFILNMRKKV